MLAKRGTQVHAMLELNVPDEMLMERLINRGKTSGRADDNEETIGKRLAVYHNQTSPLIEWYEKEGLRNAVKGHGALEEINAALCARDRRPLILLLETNFIDYVKNLLSLR